MAKDKVKNTFAMSVASIQQSSGLFAGFQMAAAYYAALILSAISVVIGLTFAIMQAPTMSKLPFFLSIGIGVIVGTVAAFIFDGLTISSLKRIKSSSAFWTVGPNFLTMAAGIGFSTAAGDQMWALFFPTEAWKSWAFAGAISAVLVATELWHKEHEAAVKKSVSRSDIVALAQAEENATMIDQLRRQESQALLQDPQFRDELREAAREEMKQQFRASMAARTVQIQEAHPEPKQKQLPAPALPEDIIEAEAETVEEPATSSTLRQQRDQALDQFGMVEDRMYKMLNPQILTELEPLQNDLNALVAELHERFPQYKGYLTSQRVEKVMEVVQLDRAIQAEQEKEQEPHTDKLPVEPKATTKKSRPTEQQQKPSAPRKKREVSGVQSKPRAVFTPEIEAELIDLLNGENVPSQNQLARHFDVSPNTIKAWKDRLQMSA